MKGKTGRRRRARGLPGLEGPFPGVSRGFQDLQQLPGTGLTCRFAAARGQDPPVPSWRQTKNVGATAEGLGPWVWGIPIKGKINVHCIYLAHWGGWRQAVPPDVREEPGGALYVHSP